MEHLVISLIKILKSFTNISDKLFFVKKPPEEIVVKDKFTESKNLIFAKLYKKIIKIVEKK